VKAPPAAGMRPATAIATAAASAADGAARAAGTTTCLAATPIMQGGLCRRTAGCRGARRLSNRTLRSIGR
jgi:hypothetical protein